MEEDLHKDVLPSVFKYLSVFDLYYASKVCRLWKKIVTNEEITRGPTCIIRYKEECLCPDNWNAIQTEILAASPVKPSINIFFNTNSFETITSEGCHCQHLPYNSYSVLLNHRSIRNPSPISGFFFPEDPCIHIHTFTIYNIPSLSELYCHEERCFFKNNFVDANIINKLLKPIFNENSFFTSSMILFSRQNSEYTVFCLDMALRDWFPKTKITVWGGKVDNITICDHVHKLPTCIEYPEIVVIIISGTQMQTYSVSINNNYATRPHIEDKLKILKENITLRKKSIGFMFAANISPALFDTEVEIFKNLFPNVPLATYYGLEAFGGLNDNVYTEILNLRDINDRTCYMIITYN